MYYKNYKYKFRFVSKQINTNRMNHQFDIRRHKIKERERETNELTIFSLSMMLILEIRSII